MDISHRPADFIIEHFPTVHSNCLKFGIDITTDAMYLSRSLITPAVAWWSTNMDKLICCISTPLATAFTGLHGANRMASNSLLECLVYAQASARAINKIMPSIADPDFVPEWDESRVNSSDGDVVISHNWDG